LALSTVILPALLAGCGRSGPSSPALRPAETALVDLYVQIARVESMRADVPDSVGPTLDRLARSHDSTAVRTALEGLEKEPERWEYVYDEIVRRLQELEEAPDPRLAPSTPAVPRVNDR
jgi:hypothetical protein